MAAKKIKPTIHPGFTIVELLIVIVVIGILAAITIIAYNGITQRAAISASQSAASQAGKRLLTYAIDNNDNYPTSLAAAGINDTSGTTFQYTVNNLVSPKTFCITATTNSISYWVSNSSNTPTSGGCAVTNLASNPSAETNSVNWSYYLPDGGATVTRPTGTAPFGSSFSRMTWTVSGSTVGGGIYQMNMGAGLITTGVTYQSSIYIRSSKAQTMAAYLIFRNVSNVTVGSTVSGSTVSVPANTWTRLTVSATAPATANSALIAAYATTGGSNWLAGDTLDGDGAMLTSGATPNNYGDGDSPGWIWNGTANASTSTGPPL